MFFFPAFISGLCAAFAGIFGKLSGLEYSNLDNRLEYFLKLLCFIIMIVLNGLMWTFFVRALQCSESSLEATIINTTTNFVFSGLLAYAIFGEVIGLLWWSGIALILLGVIFIIRSSSQTSLKL